MFCSWAGWCTGYLDLLLYCGTVVGCSQSKQIGVMDPFLHPSHCPLKETFCSHLLNDSPLPSITIYNTTLDKYITTLGMSSSYVVCKRCILYFLFPLTSTCLRLASEAVFTVRPINPTTAGQCPTSANTPTARIQGT